MSTTPVSVSSSTIGEARRPTSRWSPVPPKLSLAITHEPLARPADPAPRVRSARGCHRGARVPVVLATDLDRPLGDAGPRVIEPPGPLTLPLVDPIGTGAATHVGVRRSPGSCARRPALRRGWRACVRVRRLATRPAPCCAACPLVESPQTITTSSQLIAELFGSGTRGVGDRVGTEVTDALVHVELAVGPDDHQSVPVAGARRCTELIAQPDAPVRDRCRSAARPRIERLTGPVEHLGAHLQRLTCTWTLVSCGVTRPEAHVGARARSGAVPRSRSNPSSRAALSRIGSSIDTICAPPGPRWAAFGGVVRGHGDAAEAEVLRGVVQVRHRARRAV